MPFDDVANPTGRLTAPSSDYGDLPQISLGWIFDKACELINWVSGVDVREIITNFLAGDMDKVGRQLNAWENLSLACGDIQANLSAGLVELQRTWAGNAADAAATHMTGWWSALQTQATDFGQLSSNLRDCAEAAIETAQVIVDTVMLICDVVSAGLASACIPIYGEIELWKAGKSAWEMFNEIRLIIKVFNDLLTIVKDLLVAVWDDLTISSLPVVSSSALPDPIPRGG
ncbi:MAG: hypothetical protein ACR2JN_04240 [Lapillicoccus sp.]